MRHLDASLHTRGESAYVDDLPAPEGMLYAAVYGAPVAHGRVRTLRLDAARGSDGVVAVLTAADIPGRNQIGPIIEDESLLAEDAVHYIGQPVAVVVATSQAAAREAAQRVEIDVEPLPAVTDPREAFSLGHVIGTPRTFVLGDVDAAWATCDHVLEGTCEIQGQEHLYLETQRARAIPREGGRVKVYSSTQSPYAGQKKAAQVLGVAEHMIEVEVQRLGGGFGGKEDQATPWACMAALAARHTGRAVELVLSRHDDLRMTGKRHPYAADFKVGFMNDGTVRAYEVQFYQNAGAVADLSPAVLERTLFHCTNAYYIPNVRASGASCRTNLHPFTAFRGFGGPQGMFVIEAALARVAETVGRPREAVQRLNLLQEGDTFPYGQQAERCHARTTWDEAAQHYDLPALRGRVEQYNATHK